MNKQLQAMQQALEALEPYKSTATRQYTKIDSAIDSLRIAIADAERQANSIWVLTEEVSDYDQYGEYFVGAWNKKPTHQMLSALGVPQNRLRHVLNGGGRVGYEGAWFFLKEIEHVN
jgi:hypothetical protein